MPLPFLLLGGVAALGAGLAGWVYGHRRRIKAILQHPFPEKWEEFLDANMPVYHRLPADLRQQLRDDTQVLCALKNFEGCGGLEINDEIRVTIAAQAALLTLRAGPRLKYYPRLSSILVYPSDYITHEGDHRLGESWTTGSVVLAWDFSHHGAAVHDDGHNVVLHEFAHQLDQANGESNGAPPLENREQYAIWAEVLGREYENLRSELEHHRRTVLDPYGATDPAEFFAVATEAFFEKAEALNHKHPELYATLRAFYKLNPLEWAPLGEKKRRPSGKAVPTGR
ncbi:MAG: M90 family metallopeptidase [Verrucomicrobiota bacterium]